MLYLFRIQMNRRPLGCCLFDPEARIAGWNPAAGEIFGVEPGSLIGRSIAGFLDPEDDFGGAWAAFLAEGRLRGTRPTSARPPLRSGSPITRSSSAAS